MKFWNWKNGRTDRRGRTEEFVFHKKTEVFHHVFFKGFVGPCWGVGGSSDLCGLRLAGKSVPGLCSVVPTKKNNKKGCGIGILTTGANLLGGRTQDRDFDQGKSGRCFTIFPGMFSVVCFSGQTRRIICRGAQDYFYKWRAIWCVYDKYYRIFLAFLGF